MFVPNNGSYGLYVFNETKPMLQNNAHNTIE